MPLVYINISRDTHIHPNHVSDIWIRQNNHLLPHRNPVTVNNNRQTLVTDMNRLCTNIIYYSPATLLPLLLVVAILLISSNRVLTSVYVTYYMLYVFLTFLRPERACHRNQSVTHSFTQLIIPRVLRKGR